MGRKILLAGVLVGIMALSENPVMATTHYYNTSRVQPMSQNAKVKQPPAIKNGEKMPEPPKKDKGGDLLPHLDGAQFGQNDNK